MAIIETKKQIKRSFHKRNSLYISIEGKHEKSQAKKYVGHNFNR